MFCPNDDEIYRQANAAYSLYCTPDDYARFILKDPSSFTEELAGFLLIWIGLLGASYALYTRAHLGIDILTAKLKGTNRRNSEITIYIIV